MNLIKLQDGSSLYCLDKVSAKHTVKEIFEEGTYSYFPFKEASVIFDIGANIGLFTLFASQQAPRSTIYSFEPVPEIYKVLEKNISTFTHKENINSYNVGLGDKNENQEITFYPNSSTLSTFVPNDTETAVSVAVKTWDDYIEGISPLGRYVPKFLRRPIVQLGYRYYYKSKRIGVEIETLSNIIRREEISKIDILKIDAENYELQILNGIDSDHWSIIKNIMLEVHGNVENGEVIKKKVIDLLEKNNFSIEINSDGLYGSVGLEMVFAKNRMYA